MTSSLLRFAYYIEFPLNVTNVSPAFAPRTASRLLFPRSDLLADSWKKKTPPDLPEAS